MTDPEIEELRGKVHCAVVLERTPPLWKLDRKESTRLSLKYRRGKGEIPIVSHAGRGWWDPMSDAKADVFGLVQRLEPGLTFGHVRKRLREFAGLSPPTWRYLVRKRYLPTAIIEAACACGNLREGPVGSEFGHTAFRVAQRWATVRSGCCCPLPYWRSESLERKAEARLCWRFWH